MPAIKFSPRGYIASVWRDAHAALGRVARDRAALAALIVLILPWWALVFLRTNTDWLVSFGQIGIVIFLLWWMSRSGAAPAPEVRHPRAESLFAIVFVVIWVGWRAGICDKVFPFLPGDFNCYGNWEFEILPKLFETVVVPLAFLLFFGYRFRAIGANLNLRAFWISLPVLIGLAAYGFYLHRAQPETFVQSFGQFFAGAGLPEEFLWRAFLMTRLEAWWRSSAWGLFGASVIFGLSHLPIDYLVFTDHNWRETWITLLTFQMGFGVVFGFAYQRTRNIWPIAIIHAMVDAL